MEDLRGLNPDAGLGVPFLCVSNGAQDPVLPKHDQNLIPHFPTLKMSLFAIFLSFQIGTHSCRGNAWISVFWRATNILTESSSWFKLQYYQHLQHRPPSLEFME